MSNPMTLSYICALIEDILSNNATSSAIYISADYDNRQPFDLVKSSVEEVVAHHKRVLGEWGVRQGDGPSYRLQLVIYKNQQIADRDLQKGDVTYDRYSL